MRKVISGVIAAFLLAFSPLDAFAHAELVRSTPNANALLKKAPSQVELEFGESLTTLGGKADNHIYIFDAQNNRIKTTFTSVVKRIAKVTIVNPLKSGSYTVRYRVVSADGHILNSEFKFRVS